MASAVARGGAREEVRKKGESGTRGGSGGRERIAIHTKSIPFVPRRLLSAVRRAPTPPPSPSPLPSLSPNFVANLRATKSAPFDFTLIRCRCRAVDKGNLPFTPARDRRGFHFPRVRTVPSSQAGRQVCFKVTIFLPSLPVPRTLYHVLSFLYFFQPASPPARRPTCTPFSFVSLFLSFPLLPSPFYLDLVSRNSALTSIRGRSRR